MQLIDCPSQKPQEFFLLGMRAIRMGERGFVASTRQQRSSS